MTHESPQRPRLPQVRSVIPGILVENRCLPDPWRIGAVLDGRNPLVVGDPWLRFQFVNQAPDVDEGFEVVDMHDAVQLPAREADAVVRALAAKVLRHAFFALPPDDVYLDELYNEALMLPAQATVLTKAIEDSPRQGL